MKNKLINFSNNYLNIQNSHLNFYQIRRTTRQCCRYCRLLTKWKQNRLIKWPLLLYSTKSVLLFLLLLRIEIRNRN